MKTYQLEETSIGGDTNPLNRRYIVDGKRVTREQFDAIRRNPRVRQECFSNSNQGGVMHFYSIAREIAENPDEGSDECVSVPVQL